MIMEILHRDDLTEGGFAGLREHRLVMDSKVFGSSKNPDTWNGIGNFVYLADARFIPKGETHLHNHKEIDVISVIVEGRIDHKGSLEEGNELKTNQVQVQRAGGEGFAHNEVNPDDKENRMIQLWVTPENPGQPADYKLYDLRNGDMTRVYGGKSDQNDTFPSRTTIQVGLLNPEQKISVDGEFIAYVTRGKGVVNGKEVKDGDLIKGNNLTFQATQDAQLIVISQ